MDILIKGMKMPKRGIVVNIYPDGRVTNHFDEFGKTIGKAVPVPQHGRLIDADALLQDYERIVDSWGLAHIVSAQAVRTAPTIIPASEGET